jgi:hypothetical protein
VLIGVNGEDEEVVVVVVFAGAGVTVVLAGAGVTVVLAGAGVVVAGLGLETKVEVVVGAGFGTELVTGAGLGLGGADDDERPKEGGGTVDFDVSRNEVGLVLEAAEEEERSLRTGAGAVVTTERLVGRAVDVGGGTVEVDDFTGG